VVTCWMTKEKKIRLIAMLVVIFNFAIAGQSWTLAAASDTPQSVRNTDKQRLVGRWVRADGGYVLELKGIGKDGNLQAAYFNPRQIHVSRAEIQRKGNKITVFVELRDVNYPGSTYTLQYDPATDRLKGIYFQAALQQQYEVEFERTK
jgi:uncharacterized protein (DUF2147 family)